MDNKNISDLIKKKLLPIISNRKDFLFPSLNTAISEGGAYRPIFPFDLHSHTFFEWVWCIQGNSYLKIQNKVYRLSEGGFCLLPPGLSHADVYIPALNPYQVLWCGYHNEVISAHHHEYIEDNRLEFRGKARGSASPYLPSILRALEYEINAVDDNREEICRALEMSLIHLMLRSFKQYKSEIINDNLVNNVAQKINNYISQNYAENITLDIIAKNMYMSRNYLCTLYKQETGMTIGEKLRQTRLRHAKQLLLETQLSVKEISYAVGYRTPEHFSRLFQQIEGIAPSHYGKKK